MLRADPAPGDGRSKLLFITPKGLEMHESARSQPSCRVFAMCSRWEEAEMDRSAGRLDRLKVWMDTKGRE